MTRPWEYQDLAIAFEPVASGGYVMRVSAESGDSAPTAFTPPIELERLPEAVAAFEAVVVGESSRELGAAQLDKAAAAVDLERFGGKICEALLAGGVRDAFHRRLGAAHSEGAGLRLRLVLDAADPTLCALPWEVAFDGDRRRFLSLDPSTPIVRYLKRPVSADPRLAPAARPLRILIAAALPIGAEALDLPAERRQIEPALAGHPDLHPRFVDVADFESLRRALDEFSPHVFHFMGHGGFDPETGEGSILLPSGTVADRAIGRDLDVALSACSQLRLVVLNTCSGGAVPRRRGLDPFSALASSLLLRTGAPAVVAMQFAISDRAAIAFSSAFYAALAQGAPVEAALVGGRQAIYDRDRQRGTAEWITPVLYLRADNGKIFPTRPRVSAAAAGWPDAVDLSDSIRQKWRYLIRHPGQLFSVLQDLLIAHRQRQQRRTALVRFTSRIRQWLAEPASLPRISLRLRRVEPAERRSPRPSRPSASEAEEWVATAESLWSIFVEAGESLLLLGAAGSGKTTLLLELAQAAAIQAKRHHEQPMPVVLSLSRWRGQASLHDWILEELYGDYRVPPRIGSWWVRNGCLLLLLDGLDEVRRDRQAKCVEAIHRFLRDHGLSPIVVTCRSGDDPSMEVRLNLYQTLEVQPLFRQQIEDYLTRSQPLWARVWSQLRRDEALAELARTPLMMKVMVQACTDPEGLTVDSRAPDELRSDLFEAYIERMSEYARSEKPAPIDKFLDRLSWLARKMRADGRTIFQVEQLQPSWLATGRWIYSGLVGLLTFSLVGFLLVVGGVLELRDRGFDAESIFGLMVVLLVSFGLPAKLASHPIRTVEVVRWSWRQGGTVFLVIQAIMVWGTLIDSGVLGELLVPGFLGLLAGLLLGLVLDWTLRFQHIGAVTIAGSALGVVWALVVWIDRIRAWPSGRFADFLVSQLETSLSLGLFFFIVGGVRISKLEDRTGINIGMRRTMRNAVVFSLASSLVTALVGSVLFGSSLRPDEASFFAAIGLGALFLCYVIGVATFLAMGGFSVIKHYSLRLVLAGQGLLPWRLTHFFDQAARRVLLRRVGEGWTYLHPTLLDHFAARKVEPSTTPRRPGDPSLSADDSVKIVIDWLRRHWLWYLVLASVSFFALDSWLPDQRVEFLDLQTEAAWQVGAVMAVVFGLLGRRWRFAVAGFFCGMAWGDVAATVAPWTDKYFVVLVGTPLIGLFAYFMFSSLADEIAERAWKSRRK